MSNIINKFLAIVFVVIGLFAVTSLAGHVDANASDTSSKMQLAFMAKVDSVTGETVTRVNNWSTSAFDGYVCVQERASGRSYHLGCLKVQLGAHGTEPWAFQFGVMPKHGGSVSYTYQAPDMTWHAVRGTTTL